MVNHRLPLARFTVLDLTAHRAGPTAARQLADWGAKVLKIDMPGSAGDALGGSRDGPDFQNLHRNKQAMTLNLKSTEGREVFFRLAATADVPLELVEAEFVLKVHTRVFMCAYTGTVSNFPSFAMYVYIIHTCRVSFRGHRLLVTVVAALVNGVVAA